MKCYHKLNPSVHAPFLPQFTRIICLFLGILSLPWDIMLISCEYRYFRWHFDAVSKPDSHETTS